MKRHFFGGLLLAGFLGTSLPAQMPDGFLDVFTAKVKMGRRLDFDSINTKMAEINRKNKGDTWLAYDIVYGDENVVYFISRRTGYSAAEEGIKAFLGSLRAALGKPGMQRMLESFDATTDSGHSELRRRRWDLSSCVPRDAAEYAKLVGHARYVRVVTVHVRPGRILDFEAQLKMNRELQEKANPDFPSLVSQSVAGQQVGVYYIANLLPSLADLDKVKPLQQALGESYQRYQHAVAEMVSGVSIYIGRYLPELSNPPEEIVAVDPKFWRPAPTPPAPAKPPEKK
ncbi:MAG TPA: hypothetical protein VGL72_04845 [Bryobacteraceae bacterium]|jgi:hypothetical protein